MVSGLFFKALFLLLIVLAPMTVLLAWAVRRHERRELEVAPQAGAIESSDSVKAVILGWLLPLAERMKPLAGHASLPEGASRGLYLAAPMVVALPALVATAVVPFGSAYQFSWGRTALVLADLDAGALYLVACFGLSAVGTLMAGWSSNRPASLLEGTHCASQVLSFHVALGMSLAPVLMIFGSLRLSDIAQAQDAVLRVEEVVHLLGVANWDGWLHWFGALGVPRWGFFLQPLSFGLVLFCLLGAGRRPPFADSGSNVGGVAGMYSGAPRALLLLAELVQDAVIAAVMVTLFFGGWSIPYLPQESVIAGLLPYCGADCSAALCLFFNVASFYAKLVGMVWLLLLIRWSLPRLGYDQLMGLCWKVILPLSLINLFLTAGVILSLGIV